jgi:DNA-directed RNA polymerase
MVMNREISKGKYLLAAIITLAIFLLGMLLGLVVEGKRVVYMQSFANQQKLEFGSLQLQYQYITELGQEKNCPAVLATFETYMETLVKAQNRLEDYEKDAKLDRNEFRLIKQDYTQAELNFWLLSKKVKEICKKDVVGILYFYSADTLCADCEKQSFVLSYLKDIFKDKLLVFAIDETLDIEPMVGILKETYNITEYPSLVIEDKAFSGFVENDAILREICSLYSEPPGECKTIS